MAGRGRGSNTTHTLLNPDPETLPMKKLYCLATGEFLGTKMLPGEPTLVLHASLLAGPDAPLSRRNGPPIIP